MQALEKSRRDVGGVAAIEEGMDAVGQAELQAAIAASLADVPSDEHASSGGDTSPGRKGL